MSEPSGRDLERVLLRRQAVLEALVAESRTKPELVEQLDIPRSTLDDIVRDLSDAGLVAYLDGQWQSTPIGACAHEVHHSYAERIASLADATAVLGDVPVSRIGCAMLDGCTVYDNDGVLPDEIVMEFLERIQQAEHLRGLVPKALAGHVPTTHEAIRTGPTTRTEMVFDPAVYERVVNMYPDEMRSEHESDHVDHFQADVPVSYGLWIADDDNAGVIVYSEGGIGGIIVNDSPAAIAWARDLYEEARADAELVTDLPA